MNFQDHYEIADGFSWGSIAKNKAGEFVTTGKWAGGTAYAACPYAQLGIADGALPRVAMLGFNGLQYIDCLSICMPTVCHDEKHPCDLTSSLETLENIMKISHRVMGGFSSEGGYDFTLSKLDFCLYDSFKPYGRPAEPCYAQLTDMQVPLWELIYHGILLYNPSSHTVNSSVKHPDAALTLALYGGRPVFYFYSKFCIPTANGFLDGIGKNWMGDEDLVCDTDEQLRESVGAIKRAVDEYSALVDRQTVFMREYRVEDNGLRTVRYEDGVEIVGNYTDFELDYKCETVAPHSYKIIRE